MKKPESITKTESNRASSPRHMAEQPLSPCYQCGAVTTEGGTAPSLPACHHGSRGTIPGSAIPGSAIPTATLPLRTEAGATYLRGPGFTWGRQTEKSYPFFYCWTLAAWQRTAACWGWPWEERCRAVTCCEGVGGPSATCHWDRSTLFFYQREFILDI